VNWLIGLVRFAYARRSIYSYTIFRDRDGSGYRPGIINSGSFSLQQWFFLGRDAPKACGRMIRQLADRAAGIAQMHSYVYLFLPSGHLVDQPLT